MNLLSDHIAVIGARTGTRTREAGRVDVCAATCWLSALGQLMRGVAWMQTYGHKLEDHIGQKVNLVTETQCQGSWEFEHCRSHTGCV
jgi:hypothetical protein